MQHLNTKIPLSTRFMFKMGIGIGFKFKHRLHVFFLECSEHWKLLEASCNDSWSLQFQNVVHFCQNGMRME
jgi:hypothetical protein